MASKIIRMNEEGYTDEDGTYVYPNSDEDVGQQDYDEQEQEQEPGQRQEYDEEYPDFYSNLEIISENGQESKIKSKPFESKKNRPRSMSVDSEVSDISKRPNFKCGSCKKSFLLDKNQKMIRCSFCGYRILFKLRTRNYITYKTE